MKTLQSIIIALGIAVVGILSTVFVVQAANPVTFPVNGGTGTSTKPNTGQILTGNSLGLYNFANANSANGWLQLDSSGNFTGKTIQFQTGSTSLSSIVLDSGLIGYATDTKATYIGDGTTAGGNPIGFWRLTTNTQPTISYGGNISVGTSTQFDVQTTNVEGTNYPFIHCTGDDGTPACINDGGLFIVSNPILQDPQIDLFDRSGNVGELSVSFSDGTNDLVLAPPNFPASVRVLGDLKVTSSLKLESNDGSYANIKANQLASNNLTFVLPTSTPSIGQSLSALSVTGSSTQLGWSSGGGGGSGTVNSGLIGQVPFYASNGTTLTATSTIFINKGNVSIGTSTTKSDTELSIAPNSNAYAIRAFNPTGAFQTYSLDNQGNEIVQGSGNFGEGLNIAGLQTGGAQLTAQGFNGDTEFLVTGDDNAGDWDTLLGTPGVTNTFEIGQNVAGVATRGAEFLGSAVGVGGIDQATEFLIQNAVRSNIASVYPEIFGIASTTRSGADIVSVLSNGEFRINSSNSTTTLSIGGIAGQNPFNIASSSGASLLTLTQAGNLGLGTFNPTMPIVIGNGSTNSLELNGTQVIGTNGLTLTNNGQNRIAITNSGFIFTPNGQGGNVGIGSSTPLANLSISGVAGATTTLLESIASSSGTSIFNVSPLGTVAINSTSQSAALTVNGAPGINNPLIVSGGGTNLFTVNSSGNGFSDFPSESVGIGISGAPISALFVKPSLGGVTPFIVASSSGTTTLMVDAHGHITYGGTSPSINSCGSGATFDASSTDNAGRIFVGSTIAQTSCLINFANSWVHAPYCDANIEGGLTIGVSASSTATTLLLTGASGFTSDTLTYQCH